MVQVSGHASRHAPARSPFLPRHRRRSVLGMNPFGPIVSPEWLRAHLNDPDLRLIDFRWSLRGPGRDAYEAGHIPGAVFVDLEDVTGIEGGGRHPLPTGMQLAG